MMLSRKHHLNPDGVFPGGSMIKNMPAKAEDSGLIPGSEKSLGIGNGNPLQYSFLGNPMDTGPGGLQFMRPQGVGHDLATKQ